LLFLIFRQYVLFFFFKSAEIFFVNCPKNFPVSHEQGKIPDFPGPVFFSKMP